MSEKQSARAGGVGAVKAGRRFTAQNSRDNPETQFQPGADGAIAGGLDPQAIRVELSERRRERVPVVTCSIAEVASASSPISKLARKLLHLGIDARTPLSIWRGKTKCFHDAPVGRWARLTVEEGGSETAFRRYKPFPGRAVASQGAESDV